MMFCQWVCTHSGTRGSLASIMPMCILVTTSRAIQSELTFYLFAGSSMIPSGGEVLVVVGWIVLAGFQGTAPAHLASLTLHALCELVTSSQLLLGV